MIRVLGIIATMLIFGWHAYQDLHVNKYILLGGPHIDATRFSTWLGSRQHVKQHAIRQWFLAQPWINQVEFENVDTEVVLVKLKEAKPVARWRYGALVSEDGQLMFVNEYNEYKKLAQLAVNEVDLPQAIAFVHALMPIIAQHKDLFDPADMIVKRDQAGDWSVILDANHQLIFGTILLTKRIEVAEYVLNRLLEHHDKWGKLDLRYLNGFAISKNHGG